VKAPGHSQFVGMFIAAALAPLGSTMIAVALPSMSAELHVPGGALTQWLVTSYLVAGIAAMSPCGKLGDLIGHRRGLMTGLAVYASGSLLGFVAATLPALALARIGMAVGGSMMTPATMALLRNAVPMERRPRTFGLFGAVLATAAAIGPLLGGELTARFGWRAVFVGNLPVILVAFLLIRFGGGSLEPARARPSPPRFDIEGSVLLAAALTSLVLAARMKGPWTLWIFAFGLVLFIAFIAWERRAAEPIMELSMFTRREFVAGCSVVGLQNLAMYALLFQVPIFFEQFRHIHPGTTGRSIIGMMIATVVMSPIGGRLAERFGARPIALLGCLVSITGVWTISHFATMTTPRDALAGLILVGTGLGLSNSPSQASAMSSVGAAQAGMGAGALSTSRYVGGVIGITVLGALLDARSGVTPHHQATVCYEVALVVATLTSLMLPGRPRSSEAPAPATV
jgi:EmrB/QacA subfamily drug resistance transporter